MINTIKEHLSNLVGCVTFTYKDCSCGIDPLARDNFDVWFGDSKSKAQSIDEVMTTKYFGGKALEDILDDVADLEY